MTDLSNFREANPDIDKIIRSAAAQEHQMRVKIIDTDQKRILERLAAQGYQIPEEDIFVFSAEVSNTSVDAYFSHMHQTTLENFASGAEQGVSLLDSHDSRKLGIGYSCGGRVITDGAEGSRTRVVADFYIIRGLEYGANYSYRSSDGFIRAVETGVVRDVSVGFYGGRHICDIDGLNVWSWECKHWPGRSYIITDPETGEEKTVVATYTIYDGTLSEVSLVYDGATPSAMIIKALRGLENGELDEKFVRQWVGERRIRVNIPTNYGGNMSEMTKANEQRDARGKKDGSADLVPRAKLEDALKRANNHEGVIDAVRTVLESAGLSAEDLAAGVRQLWNDLTDARGRVVELEAAEGERTLWVQHGKRYHADLIDELVEAGVRAQGNEFPADVQREIMRTASIEHIKALRDSYESMAKANLESGRHINDEADEQHRDGGDDDERGQQEEWQPENPVGAYS